MVQQYTVKAGDSLNKIAQDLGFSDYKAAGITGYGDNPDLIKPGQVLSIGGGTQTSPVPGIGTMTITPKVPAAGGPGNTDMSGVYARTGVTPPPGLPAGAVQTPSGAWVDPASGSLLSPPKVDGLPTYPGSSSGAKTPSSSILDSYHSLLSSITDIENKLRSNATPSADEQALSTQLAAKKAALQNFDVETLSKAEALRGQGRGISLNHIAITEQQQNRTRAIERLGLANEAQQITDQLGLAQDARKSLSDEAKMEYDLASKRLDIAMNVQDEIDKLNKQDQTEARQYLLDVVSFADGKSYDKLDASTQTAIMHAVANSPITLDMVKIALQSGSDKAAAAARGDLRSVAGVGVVQINQDGSYKIVVPEKPKVSSSSTDTSKPSVVVPSFDQYLGQYIKDKNLPLPMLTKELVAQVQADYDKKYSSVNISLGKLTPTNANAIKQAGLNGSPSAVQSYFLNTPAAFQDEYQRTVATGKAPAKSVSEISSAYTTWYDAQQAAKKTSTGHDWSAIFGTPVPTK